MVALARFGVLSERRGKALKVIEEHSAAKQHKQVCRAWYYEAPCVICDDKTSLGAKLAKAIGVVDIILLKVEQDDIALVHFVQNYLSVCDHNKTHLDDECSC